MDDHLGIGVRAKMMSLLFQLVTQLFEIIDLSVANDPNRFVLVGNRLMASLQVNDAEAAHAEANTAVIIMPFIIRAAMHNHASHACQNFPIQRGVPVQASYTVDSTHRHLVHSNGFVFSSEINICFRASSVRKNVRQPYVARKNIATTT